MHTGSAFTQHYYICRLLSVLNYHSKTCTYLVMSFNQSHQSFYIFSHNEIQAFDNVSY